jgi:excisionase family DNA binding protein
MGVDRKTVSITKACALVDVSRRTLYYWMQSGKVPYLVTAGGRRRIVVDALFQTTPRRAHAPAGRAPELPPFPVGPLLLPHEYERLRMARMGLP